MRKFVSDSVFAILVFGVFCASPAYAYLDNATISLILQATTGLIASWLVFGKMYWSKFVGLFRSKTTAIGNDQQD